MFKNRKLTHDSCFINKKCPKVSMDNILGVCEKQLLRKMFGLTERSKMLKSDCWDPFTMFPCSGCGGCGSLHLKHTHTHILMDVAQYAAVSSVTVAREVFESEKVVYKNTLKIQRVFCVFYKYSSSQPIHTLPTSLTLCGWTELRVVMSFFILNTAII